MDKLTHEFEEVFQVDEPLLVEETTPANVSDDENENERHVEEANKATTLEEKEKFLAALKSKGDQIKSVMGEFLKNTW